MDIDIKNNRELPMKTYILENPKNTFYILEKEEEEENNDNYGFHDLSFKEFYISNHLFSHVITHLNSFLDKNKNSNEKIVINIKKISEFINDNHFSEEILENILLNGIPNNLHCLRPLVWKSFIGYFPPNDLSKWLNIVQNNYTFYKLLKKKYQYYPNNIESQEDKKLITQLNKDLPRTRANVPFFKNKANLKKNSEEINYDIIKRILFFFAKEHQISYVQGMNELIAIIYYIFYNDDNPFFTKYVESDAYYCFSALVEEIEPIFRLSDAPFSQLFINKQIQQINEIMAKCEPEIFNYLRDIDLSIDNFAIRWIMFLFAQEFKIDVAVNFWDRMFTQKNKMKFICFITVAILKKNKDKIVGKEFDDIAIWLKEMGNNINKLDINEIIRIAFDMKKEYNKHNLNDMH